MKRHTAGFAVLIAITFPLHAKEALKMTIQGESQENAPLETLTPDPAIPNPEDLPFSLDGGKSAMEGEMVPLTLADAALMTGPAILPTPALSLIPSAPYIVHQIPTAVEEAQMRRKKKKAAGEMVPVSRAWSFSVLDDRNHEAYRVEGAGDPPNPLTWDGQSNNRFVLDPNRVYTSLVVLSSSGTETTLAGTAARFTAFAQSDGKNTWIHLGQRIYVPDRSEFTDQGRLYIGDIARRIAMLSLSTRTAAIPWTVTLLEPSASRDHIGPFRQALWKKELETQLHRAVPVEHILLSEEDIDEPQARVFIPHPLPSTEPALRGEARYMSPSLDAMPDLVQVREEKDRLIVEMRHDRLFEPGTAYLRDEAMPYLMAAIGRAKNALQTPPPHQKKVLLRSFVKKTHDEKRDALEEDPKLSATRSKVLFGLFAREGLLPAKNISPLPQKN